MVFPRLGTGINFTSSPGSSIDIMYARYYVQWSKLKYFHFDKLNITSDCVQQGSLW